MQGISLDFDVNSVDLRMNSYSLGVRILETVVVNSGTRANPRFANLRIKGSRRFTAEQRGAQIYAGFEDMFDATGVLPEGSSFDFETTTVVQETANGDVDGVDPLTAFPLFVMGAMGTSASGSTNRSRPIAPHRGNQSGSGQGNAQTQVDTQAIMQRW